MLIFIRRPTRNSHDSSKGTYEDCIAQRREAMLGSGDQGVESRVGVPIHPPNLTP